jgi:hypothetical protein
MSALRTLALQDCHEPEDVLADRIRRTMGLKATASVAPKLLTRVMPMTVYTELFAYYTNLKGQLARTPKGPSDGSPTPQDALSIKERDQTAPFVSSSAPAAEPNATTGGLLAAQAKLRAEAIGWDVRESEVDHILNHHPLPAARNLLWKARRQPSQPEALVAD